MNIIGSTVVEGRLEHIIVVGIHGAVLAMAPVIVLSSLPWNRAIPSRSVWKGAESCGVGVGVADTAWGEVYGVAISVHGCRVS